LYFCRTVCVNSKLFFYEPGEPFGTTFILMEMQQRLVLWGEIGMDRKALVAIRLEEEQAKIYVHAIPKEQVTKEVQDAIVGWKNGGEFEFPASAFSWVMDANQDAILPEEVRVEKPDMITQAQTIWSKKLMSTRINLLLTEETDLLIQKAELANDYDQGLWDKAKQQWDKIAAYQKKGEINWDQTTALKEKINGVFDTLKAVRRLHSEQDEQQSHIIYKQIEAKVQDLQNKLIYPDEWKQIFNELKKAQEEIKNATMKWGQKRQLYDAVNSIFNDLRKYRSTEVINKTRSRMTQLNKILDGMRDSITRDAENLKAQVEKMQHYTRGKLSVEEIQKSFSHITDRIKEKEKKAEGIKKTIAELKNEIEKEKKSQAKKEEEQTTKAAKPREEENEETMIESHADLENSLEDNIHLDTESKPEETSGTEPSEV
jgi:hypothetical protein